VTDPNAVLVAVDVVIEPKPNIGLGTEPNAVTGVMVVAVLPNVEPLAIGVLADPKRGPGSGRLFKLERVKGP
jgi:hypothetical protein